jgi:BirA family transcriptional regulator, biotin operon repressor / biotin---[acetyl-CoA-carboxylase] ligase
MDEAWLLAKHHFPDRTLVLANRQTNARGRRGRSWFSPQGNLSLSLLLRPRVEPSGCFAYAFIFALAMGKTLEKMLPPGVSVSYKWPNDLYVADFKIGGILLESEIDPQTNRLRWLIGGVGVNLINSPAEAPYPVISLKQLGVDVLASDMLSPFCIAFHHLENLFQEGGFGAIRERWIKQAYGLGQLVKVHSGADLPEEGIFQDIDAEGAMVLRMLSGEHRRILTGDVSLVSPKRG